MNTGCHTAPVGRVNPGAMVPEPRNGFWPISIMGLGRSGMGLSGTGVSLKALEWPPSGGLTDELKRNKARSGDFFFSADADALSGFVSGLATPSRLAPQLPQKWFFAGITCPHTGQTTVASSPWATIPPMKKS